MIRVFRGYLAAGAPVGKYLADQLLLPLGIGTNTERVQNAVGGSVRSENPVRIPGRNHEPAASLRSLPLPPKLDPFAGFLGRQILE